MTKLLQDIFQICAEIIYSSSKTLFRDINRLFRNCQISYFLQELNLDNLLQKLIQHIEIISMETTKNQMNPNATHQILLQQSPNLQKIKPILNPSPKWKCKTSSDIARICKNKLKTHSSILINGLRSENLPTISLRNLLRAAIDTKRTACGNFEVSNFNIKQLSQIANFTNQWKNLRLYTSPNEKSDLNFQLLQALSNLSRCKNLIAFPIIIDFPQQPINKEITDRLCRERKRFTRLEYLCLNIPLCGNPEVLTL